MGWRNLSEKGTRTKVRKQLGRAFGFLFRKLDQISVRSYTQVVVHVLIGLALAVVLYYCRFVGPAISDSSLVIILAAVAAASGALLAVSVALGIFSSQHYTDWSYRSHERLANVLEKLKDGMEKWAWRYPGISGRLGKVFKAVAEYRRGEPVDIDKVIELDVVFYSWVNEELAKSGKKIDFGNVRDYESFERYAYDAALVAKESIEALMEVGIAERYGRSLTTHASVLGTWAMVVVFSLVFAIIGSLNIIPDKMNLSILIVPIYLCFFAGSAVVIDYRGLLRIMRVWERGYEMSKSAGMGQNELKK